MDRDIVYNILLQMDINDISALMTDKVTHQNINAVLNDAQFWFDKFSHDQLPIMTIGNNAQEWIIEYDNVVEVTRSVNNYMNDVLKNNKIEIFFNPKYIDDSIRNLLPHTIHFTPYSIKYINNKIFYNPGIIGWNQAVTFDMDLDELRLLLFKIIYYKIRIYVNIEK
jgi:hypothetical protein